jgi:hypothetical protein
MKKTRPGMKFFRRTFIFARRKEHLSDERNSPPNPSMKIPLTIQAFHKANQLTLSFGVSSSFNKHENSTSSIDDR